MKRLAKIGTVALAVLLGAAVARSEVKSPLVILPKDVRGGESLPVAIWLHGYGANPSKIVSEPLYQYTADRLHIAIVGVYATNEMAEDAFEWSELLTVDYAQVMESLKLAEREKDVHFTKKVLFGFSQGACLAAELAARHPEEFAGAIVLSPGANTLSPEPLQAVDGNGKQSTISPAEPERLPGISSIPGAMRSTWLRPEPQFTPERYRECRSTIVLRIGWTVFPNGSRPFFRSSLQIPFSARLVLWNVQASVLVC